MVTCSKGVPWQLYASRLISAWGDRMWMFAVGLFMVALSPESLKWPAIYGLTESSAIVLLGSVIGGWVDKTPRWKAAKTSLGLQNLLVVACAACVALTFFFRETLVDYEEGWGLTAACSLIVILGTLASLASTAMSIAVYKDWIAIIADGDNELLAQMNSTCRSIDLATNIIAPIAVGQVMYFVSHIVAAVFIAGWNVVSFFVECFLLWQIYKKFPKLTQKERAQVKDEIKPLNDSAKKSENDELSAESASSTRPDIQENSQKQKKNPLSAFTNTWKIYFSHEVRNAGVGLALLYLTVLGFDSITIGYAYSQGVPESLLGILLALGAGVGLLGSIAFPMFVRCVGVERTGLYGFGFEVVCLTLCVGSVWAPGSPFDPSFLWNSNHQNPFPVENFTSQNNISEMYSSSLDSTEPLVETLWNSSFHDPLSVLSLSNMTTNNTTTDAPQSKTHNSYVSVMLLMSGIIAARFGLWMADLSVNQILQLVDDDIRGTINGVQSSMNMIFDTAKFLLVIACPWPQTFGILVCISFSAVASGWAFYCSYSYLMRGHLLPFHKVIKNLPPEKIHQVIIYEEQEMREKMEEKSDPFHR